MKVKSLSRFRLLATPWTAAYQASPPILNDQKQDGVGILFVGEDLDVMLALCDKIMVLCHGKVMGVVHAHKTTKEELGLMMTGSLDLTYKYEDKPAGIAKDSRFSKNETEEEA